MVFDPTFNAISQDADALPDLAGDAPEVLDPDGAIEQKKEGGMLAPDTADADGEQDDAIAADLEGAIAAGDVDPEHIPPYGA